MSKKVLAVKTIGVFDSTEESFFKALLKAKVDTFCDIRQRRAVRGSDYTYANANRLESKLKKLGMRYVHMKDLAPTPQLIQRQIAIDKSHGISIRSRQELSEDFKEGYKKAVLKNFNAKEFISKLPVDCRVLCLFCVEQEARACHRSILAETLRRELHADVEHLYSRN